MLGELWVALLIASAGVVLLYQGVAIAFAYAMPKLGPGAPVAGAPEPLPVSVIVAARNEEEDLPATLDALLLQDAPPLEILVVDGGSTDRTAGVIDARAPRVRRLAEPPLPDGWVGKSWGCWTGANRARGDWLLFLDADVRLAPSAIRRALEWAEGERADLASLASRIEMESFWERLLLPFYVQMVLVHLRAPRVNRDTSSSAMANGQFLLVRRAAYAAVGGHARVRSAILEDVALAEAFRAERRRLRIAWAPALLTTRMYRDRAELDEGLLKTVHGVRYDPAVQLGRLVGLVGLFLLPLGLLPLGWAVASAPLVVAGAIVLVALFGKHVAFARASGAPAVYGLLYPLAAGYYAGLLARSLVRGLTRRPIVWKGRAYPLRT